MKPRDCRVSLMPISDGKIHFAGDPEDWSNWNSLDNVATINFVDELGGNYDAYYIRKAPGVSWINITTLPSKLRTTLDKLKMKASSTRFNLIGLPPALCCAIKHGMYMVAYNTRVQDLREARQFFDELEQEGTPREEFIAQYFRTTPRAALDGTRQNVAVPEEVKGFVASTAINLGVTESDLAVIAAMCVICKQPEVAPNYREIMSATVNEFFLLLEMKAKGARALLDMLHERH